MATYDEIFDLSSNNELRNRVAVAVIKKAQSLLDLASPSIAQVTWANNALKDPILVANQLLHYVLAANSSSTVSAITGASDSTIQTNVDAAADKILSGGV